MRGRMGVGAVLLLTAMLAAGCQTPAQREHKKQMDQEKKMAASEAKKQKEVAAAEAKHQKEVAAAEAKRQKEEAARRAEEDRQAKELARKQAEKEKREAAAIDKENKTGVGGEMIRDERNVRSVDRFMLAQAAAGAREDATLTDAHFDGGELNALGRSKLYLMGKAVPAGSKAPVMVYVSGDSKLSEVRTAAVASYWKSSQYADLALQTKAGVNDNNTTPAKVGLDGLKKMEETSTNSSNSSKGSVGGSGSTPAAAPTPTP